MALSETVDFITILQGVADLAGLDRENISGTSGSTSYGSEFAIIRDFLRKRLQTAWEHDLWPELTLTEKRYFRNLFTPGTTLAAPTTTTVAEIYYPDTTKYYQALRALPLTVSSITRVTTTATVTTSASHLLSTGDRVSISGAVETDYNVTATITVTGATTFTYTVQNSPTTPATGTIKATPDPANASGNVNKIYWAESLGEYTGEEWDNTESNVKGDVRYWHGTDRFYVYYNTAASTGNQPTNTTYWAVLTEFSRYVAYEQTGKTKIGDVLRVTEQHPKHTSRLTDVAWSLTDDGVHVESPVPFVHMIHRKRWPILKGALFSTTATYTANVSQVYFSSTSTAGNMYDCVTSTSAGESPDSAAAKWTKVEIPLIFERYLVAGAYSDWLRADGQESKAAFYDSQAQMILGDQSALLDQQQQRKQLIVLTR